MSQFADIKSRIFSVRDDFGLNSNQFAKEIGIHQQTLSDIENEKSKVTLNVLLAVCNKFHVSPTWLAWELPPKYLDPSAKKKVSDVIQRGVEIFDSYLQEVRNYPVEKFYEKTLEVDNFRIRHPWIEAQGLFKLIEDKEAVEKLLFSTDELNMLERAIESNPSLYNQADADLFLQLIRSYRKQRLTLIEQYLTNKKAIQSNS